MSPQNIYAKWNPKKKLHAWPWSTQLLCTSISLKSRKRSKADFTVGNAYSWLTIFRKDRVLLSCTVGPCFQNWIYEVMFNMFLSVEGVNPLLELEKRRQVQRLMNNSWRKTKYINAARLAQLGEHWSAEREDVASNSSRTNNQSLQKTAWWDHAGCYLRPCLS